MEYTERTQSWLDQRVCADAGAPTRGSFYDDAGAIAGVPVEHVLGVARALSIAEALARLEFASCLDVGAGTGWIAHLIRCQFGAGVASIDLSREFCVRARRAFALPAYAANAAALPFADDSFDVVVCSEVLEHVEHPLAVLAELKRVARRAVVLTTQETCLQSWERRLLIASADDRPHAERNFFVPSDFVAYFGRGADVRALMQSPEKIRLFGLRNAEELAECVLDITGDRALVPGSYGVVVTVASTDSEAEPRFSRREILDNILGSDRALGGASGFRTDWRIPDAAEAAPPLLADPVPVCPACGGVLDPSEDAIRCGSCGRDYGVDRGVPLLLAPEAVVLRNEAQHADRAELADLRRALQGPRWGLGPAGRGARTMLRLRRFVQIPLPPADKARLVWRRLRG